MLIIDGPLLISHIVTYNLFKVNSAIPHNVSHRKITIIIFLMLDRNINLSIELF